MNKKLQVFVSSTYTDLIAERQAAVEAILSAGHIPAGMELFAAGDEEQMKVIRDWIDDSDVYMLILGGRYGSIEKKSGKSYTQLEYEYAVEKKKPLFAVYMTEEYFENKLTKNGSAVMERNDSAALNSFRTKVLERISREFNNLEGLKLAVHHSLGHILRDDSLIGWVKGSEVVDTKKTLEQIIRLQAENEKLRLEMEMLRANLAIQESPPLRDALGDDAKKLLLDAKNNRGKILFIQMYRQYPIIKVGSDILNNPQDDERERSRWKAAIDELLEYRLIEVEGQESFRVTKLGYDLADEIEAMNAASQKQIDTSESGEKTT